MYVWVRGCICKGNGRNRNSWGVYIWVYLGVLVGV